MNLFDVNKQLSCVFKNGTLPTMLYMTKQNNDGKKTARPLHHHDSITEFVFVYKGTGMYRINNQTYPLSEGDIALYNQNDLHEVLSEGESEIGTYAVGITNLFLNDMPQNHFVAPGKPYVRKGGAMSPYILATCEQIFQLNFEQEQGKAISQLLCSSLIAIISQLDHFSYANLSDSKEDQFVLDILTFINSNFTEPISIGILAERFHCSQSHISHKFKKVTGHSPIDYITQRRIGMAQNLLISTDLTATDIATRVGYDNTNYFSTIFSKVVGKTPINYREDYLKSMRGLRKQI
ncbi:AraC family transcriptional regulator [Enterococcus sp. AZ109]|uniref:helix-turn-helix transcriptional regulator n=1 Tax=Enterococcus sp. AZ109 TaxID=2774634 RepID=UPI003F21A250